MPQQPNTASPRQTRLNVLLSAENHRFLAAISIASRRNLSQTVNAVIDQYRQEHPAILGEAESALSMGSRLFDQMDGEKGGEPDAGGG